jgi:GTP-sensing pleiotropic transcriptional regulator CodY
LPLIEAVINANKSILKDEFFNALTTNETIAFTAIKEEIGLSGNISVVKMIQKTTLSRPVWTSLLQKMEKYNVAIVKSQGVKGTYIEFMEAPIDD